MILTEENTQRIAVTGRQILTLILADYRGPAAIRLWNGELAIALRRDELYARGCGYSPYQ